MRNWNHDVLKVEFDAILPGAFDQLLPRVRDAQARTAVEDVWQNVWYWAVSGVPLDEMLARLEPGGAWDHLAKVRRSVDARPAWLIR